MPSIKPKKVFASLPRVERGKPVRITGDPKHGAKFLYCNGTSVFIRDLKNPVEVDIYTEHSKAATVARYSPSGSYIASGDKSGKIRIWDTVNQEHILKAEYPVLGGPICELAWCPDSKKIAVCGEGREKFACVINMDTGTSAGEIVNHSKAINTISYRPARPFRIVTASEDMTVNFYEGPPFKFNRSERKHTNFVNAARFSYDGDEAVSGGADGKLFKYDGKTLDLIQELGTPKAHEGGIYEVCFSPDNQNKEILTVSGDKTAKIFNVESGELVCVFDMTKCLGGNTWHNMLLGGLWQKDEIIVVNGCGHIIYLDRINPDKPKRVIKGHMKPITSLAVSEDKNIAFSGGQEGIVHWDVESGDNDTVRGKGHSSEVTDMVISGDNLYSVGVDDTLRVTSVSAKKFSGTEMKLDSQPWAVDCKRGTVVVACENHLMVFEEGKGGSILQERKKVALELTPDSVSIHPDGASVAVGFRENMVISYSLPALEERNKIHPPEGKSSSSKEKSSSSKEVKSSSCNKDKTDKDNSVSCLAYSPDKTCLAFSTGKKVKVVSAENYEDIGQSEKHTARVLCMAWSPNGGMFATCGLDSVLRVWSCDMKPQGLRLEIKAHAMSFVNKLAWLNNNSIITVGQDSNIKQFELILEQRMQEQSMEQQQVRY